MLYIRTDMNNFIATGHVMRCLSIADAAREAGEDVLFILADGQALGLVRSRGFRACVLGTRWDHMEEEADALCRVVRGLEEDVLLVDSYMATPGYLHKLSKRVKTAYIDDLGKDDYPVSILICYAGYWEKFHYPQRYMHARLLLGTQYAPLRKEFQNLPERKVRPQVENVLILSGGTDRFGILAGLLGRINKAEYRNIDVVCGQYYEEYGLLRRRFADYGNIHIHKAVKNMEEFMMRADAAVSAGGTALYELCACGTPSVSYSFADNQLDNVLQFQKDGLIDYAGDVRETDICGRAVFLLQEYGSRYGLRRERSHKMQQLVDGKGAARIVRELRSVHQPGKENRKDSICRHT